MTEHLEPDLLKLLTNFAWGQQYSNQLAEWLEARGDRRAEDVREIAAVPLSLAQKKPGGSDSYLMAAGEWWHIRRYPGGVMCRLLPGTQQRANAERWGVGGATFSFIPVSYRDGQNERGRQGTLEDAQDLMSVNSYLLAMQFKDCLRSLVTLQLGAASPELRNRQALFGGSHRLDTLEEYSSWVRSQDDGGEFEMESLVPALHDELRNPELPRWLTRLYQNNPGRALWILALLFGSRSRRHAIAWQVIEELGAQKANAIAQLKEWRRRHRPPRREER